MLKYDKAIPLGRKKSDKLVKGYYKCDSEIVSLVKENISQSYKESNFKTLECSIMDVADDIAYSTYDLEDSFKAGFLDPMSILSSDEKILERVATKVKDRLGGNFGIQDVMETLIQLFGDILLPREIDFSEISEPLNLLDTLVDSHSDSKLHASVGYFRTRLTSDLVGKFITSVSLNWNSEYPCLSNVKLSEDALREVEVLKNYTYEATILSSRLKVVEHRGYQIVHSIFDGLIEDDEHRLLPDDVRAICMKCSDHIDKNRVICDFVASMTDRYALEFYERMFGQNPQSIFKPI